MNRAGASFQGSLWLTLLAALPACQSTPSGGLPAYTVLDRVFTVIITNNPDGTVGADHNGDPERVGPKEVQIQIRVMQPMTLRNVLLTHWLAGNNAGSRTIETAVNQAFTPPPGGIAVVRLLLIPGSQDLRVCEGLYYMLTVHYVLANGTPGTFIGEPKLILPTKVVGASGTITEALCAQPPGPGA